MGDNVILYKILPIRMGIGDPSSDNIRPILPGLSLLRDDGTTLDVYGGTLDATNLTLSVNRRLVTLTGSESWQSLYSESYKYFVCHLSTTRLYLDGCICSHFTSKNISHNNTIVGIRQYYSNNQGRNRVDLRPENVSTMSVDNFKAYLREQYQLGTPVSILVTLVTPTTYQLTANELNRALISLGISLYSLTESRRKIILNSPHITSGSGSIVTVNDAIKAKLKSCVVDIKPVQNGTGDPSPTNIRRINGFDDVNIKIASKNLLISGYSAFNVLANVYGNRFITLDTTSKTAVCNFAGSSLYLGVIQRNNNRNTQIQGENYYPFKQNTQYTFIFKASKVQNGRLNIGVSLNDGTTVVFSKSDLNAYGYIVYTSPVNKTVASLYVGSYDAGDVIFYYDTFGVYEGVVTYEEHISQYGTTYPITWQTEAGTVYGGTLDVTNGVLTVYGTLITLKGNEGWMKLIGDNPYFYLTLGRTKIYMDDSIEFNSYSCSHYPISFIATFNTNIGCRIFYSTSVNEERLIFRPNEYSSLTVPQWKAYLADQYSGGTPVQFCAKLDIPFTYQLTPTQISTLLGTNNIWADTGDISVKYWAHP